MQGRKRFISVEITPYSQYSVPVQARLIPACNNALVANNNTFSTKVIPADTLNFGAQAQIAPQKKESFISKHWGKLLIGAGVVAFGALCVASSLKHRAKPFKSIEEVQAAFQKIFRKDMSKEHSQKMLDKYKDIMKIEDKNTFITKVFEQMKKDYGLESCNIALKTNEANTLSAGACGYKEIVIKSKGSKQEIFGTIAHELNHTVQNKYSFNSSVESKIERYIAVLLKNPETKKIYEKNPKHIDEMIKSMMNKEIAKEEQIYGKYTPFKHNSAEDILAQKYSQGVYNYIKPTFWDMITETFGQSKYRNQFIEKESSDVERLAKSIYGFLSQ